MTGILGIDVSQETLVCTLLDPKDQSVKQRFQVANSAAGYGKLFDEVSSDVPWVMEPTGRYSLSVATAAVAAGRKVFLAPTKKARKYMESLDTRAKTDRIDSEGLAKFGLSRPLRPYPLKTPEVERLQQLLTVRRRLAVALMSFHQQRHELPAAADAIDRLIETLEDEMKELDAQLRKLIKDTDTYPRIRLLESIQGIGPVTASAVGACLQDKQFTHPDQFVSFVGYDLKVQDSGKRKGKRGLSKEGPGELRRLLYLAAQANLRCTDSPFKDLYEHEKKKGFSTTAALCIVARKLARVCWSIHKYGKAYDPALVRPKADKKTEEAGESK